MACKGCEDERRVAEQAHRHPGRVYSCPLDGAEIEIVVRGEVTAQNQTLVQQWMAVVYDILVAPLEATHGN